MLVSGYVLNCFLWVTICFIKRHGFGKKTRIWNLVWRNTEREAGLKYCYIINSTTEQVSCWKTDGGLWRNWKWFAQIVKTEHICKSWWKDCILSTTFCLTISGLKNFLFRALFFCKNLNMCAINAITVFLNLFIVIRYKFVGPCPIKYPSPKFYLNKN